MREVAPKALRVLDMQDCHFLRKGRCVAWILALCTELC